jgi:hypothetical protein
MLNKGVLIGTFVNKKQILQFLEMLKVKFHIDYDKIFVYSIEENNYEYLVTFKALNKELYLKNIKNATVMHVKNGCLFSINALNKLIEEKTGSNNKEYKLEWDLYKDKLIILTNGNLSIENINKIDDKCVFFK